MIGWITEPDRREAVLIHEKKAGFELFGRESVIYRSGTRFLLRVPYGLTVLRNPDIGHQAVTVIQNPETNQEASVFWSMYDSGYETFRRVSWGSGRITLGSSIDDDIYLQDRNVRPRQFVISLQDHRIRDQYRSGIGDLSGTAVTDSVFHDGDRFRVLNVQIMFSERFLAVSSAANTYCSLPEIILPETILPEPEPSFFPVRSYQEPAEELHLEYELDPPAPLENTDRRPLVFMMGPALMMSSASLITGLLSAYNGWLSGRQMSELLPVILLPSVMVLSALLWNPLQRLHERRSERIRKQKRCEEYRCYLTDIHTEIKQHAERTGERREQRFRIADPYEKDLWRAQPNQADYLNLRLGMGDVRCDVQLNRSFRCTASDPIGKEIRELEDNIVSFRMPVLIPLERYRRISVTYDDAHKDYLIGLFLQLLFFHGPDSLKLVLLCTADLIMRYPWLTELPHLRNGNGLRMIACTAADAAEIAASLQEKEGSETLVICFRPALLSLFEGCDVRIVMLSANACAPADAELRVDLGETGTVCGSGIRQTFEYDPLFAKSVQDCLSLFQRCRIPEQSGRNSRSCTLFDLYDRDLFRSRKAELLWEHASAADHLYAAIGIGDDGETIRLDLNENGNGPHGLIAGMTGSGKSELIITMLLSLCIHYSPREFQFVMVDFKGGGAAALFSNRKRRIRHVAGILSNLDESDTERALVSFQNECLRREQLFSSLGKAVSRPVMNLKQYQKLWSEDTGLPYLAALLIVVDEFAELKKEQPDVMRDLISVARVGRSLGIHMILATQKPGGIVDEQIWSNTRFRLCLKVQDKADSTEMIHSPDAALIRRPGEGFLLCDGIRTHFQCGYANAPVTGERRKLQLLDTAGHVVREEAMQETETAVQSEYVIAELCRNGESYEPAHPLWCEPLGQLSRQDLPEDHEIWLGIIDDYRNRRQIPYAFKSSLMAVFSSDREEKSRFLRTVLAGVLECAQEEDEVFILDDLGLFDDSVTDCGTVCARLTSRDEERSRNLLRHMQERERSVSGTCTLLITELVSFYECNEEHRLLLRSLMTTAQMRKLRLVLCVSSVSSIAYRDLSMIRERIALKNDSLPDLSAIFEQSVHRRITKDGMAMCLAPELLDLCFLGTSGEDLLKAVRECAVRLGTGKRYVIPSMPAKISLSDYPGDQYPLGIDLHSYQWVAVPKGQCLIVLATYEEELYEYHEVMKKMIETILFLPEEQSAAECLQERTGGWIFLSLELFQSYSLKQNTAPVLYIGTGFHDQYRFTYRGRNELKENQGILFQRGRNCILQLIERT